ncbi:serine/threonine protein kinase [Sphingomonadaceae bacterium OTU29LAMAA1]|nr:serine/threonine protein kinase [Sphingomonadaceae bacterium OTU29LAMAA1]
MAKKPKAFGRWQVQESFDGGGQADIFTVTDSLGEHHGEYALKRLKNQKRVERFTREIFALRKLEGHPNIVTLIDADPSDSPSWFVMGLGIGSLEKCAPEGVYPIERAIRLFRQICSGVAALHDEGVIHRDLKPDNVIMMTGGDARVGDLGLCLLEDMARITPDWEAVGPRYYMAPEAEAGRDEEADFLMDVYSLGKILYWLLTGKTLVRERLRTREFALPGKREHAALDEFNVVIEGAIAEHKRDRIASVPALLERFEAAVTRFEVRPQRTLSLKRASGSSSATFRDLPALSSDELAEYARLVLDDGIVIATEYYWALALALGAEHVDLAITLLGRLDDSDLRPLLPDIANHYFSDADQARSLSYASIGWRDRDIRPLIMQEVTLSSDKDRLTWLARFFYIGSLGEHLDLGTVLHKIGPPVTWSLDLLAAAFMKPYPGRNDDMQAIIDDAGDDIERFMPALEVLAKSKRYTPERTVSEMTKYVKMHQGSPRIAAQLAEAQHRNSGRADAEDDDDAEE